MNKHSIIFLGLDTHKEFHDVAYCEEQRGSSALYYGHISLSNVRVKKLIRQFESKYPRTTLHIVMAAPYSKKRWTHSEWHMDWYPIHLISTSRNHPPQNLLGFTEHFV